MEFKKCPPCEGTGRAWCIGPEKCAKCLGKRVIPIDPDRTVQCGPCDGTGRLNAVMLALCEVCDGYGEVDPHPSRPEPGSLVWFVENGQPRTQRKQLADLLATLTGDAIVCDPFFGPGVLSAMQNLEGCSSVRCLTGNLQGGKATVDQQVKEFRNDFPQMEFRYRAGGALHDRYVATISKIMIIGHGLKDFGKRESFVVVLDEQHAEDTIKTVMSTFEAHWQAASLLG